MRDRCRAIVRVSRNGYGIERAAGSVHWYVMSEGPQVVFLNASGALYALPQTTPEVSVWLQQRADCWVGNYTLHDATAARARDLRNLIIDDIRARLLELRSVGALNPVPRVGQVARPAKSVRALASPAKVLPGISRMRVARPQFLRS